MWGVVWEGLHRIAVWEGPHRIAREEETLARVVLVQQAYVFPRPASWVGLESIVVVDAVVVVEVGVVVQESCALMAQMVCCSFVVRILHCHVMEGDLQQTPRVMGLHEVPH